MKKGRFLFIFFFYGVILCPTLCTADAEGVVINGWGRAVLSPAGSDLNSTVGSTLAGTWGSDANAGISVSGSSEHIGFQIDIDCNPQLLISSGEQQFVKGGGNQKLWAKPCDGLIVSIGKFVDRDLGGSASYGIQQWLSVGNNNASRIGNSATFRVVGGRELATDYTSTADRDSGIGGMLLYSGIKNLKTYMVYDIGASQEKAQESVHGTASSADILAAYSTYGAVYTVDNFGAFKTQYIGEGYNADDERQAEINIAADFTAVPGFVFSLGGYIPLDWKKSVRYTDPDDPDTATYSIYKKQVLVTAYSRCDLGVKKQGRTSAPVTIHVLAQDGIGTTDCKSDVSLGIGADFNFSDTCTLNTDVRWSQDDGTDSDGDTADTVMFLVGIVKSYQHGTVGIGFEGATNSLAPVGYGTNNNGYIEDGKFGWAVPIKIEYWF